MYLVDTNVWLEMLLRQEKAEEARIFIQQTHPQPMAITEMSLYSIGIIMTRLNEDDEFGEFLTDIIELTGVTRIRLEIPDLLRLVAARKQFSLDFDDAYQYVAAEKYDLRIVSFDADFDRTGRGRMTPSQALDKS